MSIDTMPEMLRVGSGRPGVPRWLTGPKGAVLLSGQTSAPHSAPRRALATPVLMRTGTAEALLAALTPLQGAEPLPAGMLDQPEWDIARDGDSLCRIVEDFGGAASRLVLHCAGRTAQTFDHTSEHISLGGPRFRRGGTASPLELITAVDRITGRLWRLNGAAPGVIEPLGEGLRALALATPSGDVLLSTSARPGGRSPLGDAAGQLHLAPLDKDGTPNGHRPLPGAEAHQIYDFDAATTADGALFVLAATRQGLWLFSGTPDRLDPPAQITSTPVLHPALLVAADHLRMAHNSIESGIAAETWVATLPRPAQR